MADQFSVVTQSVVTVRVTSSGNTFGSERRFQKDLTVAEVKGKLEMVTGSVAGNMKLEVYGKDDKLVCKLDNDDALLGSYTIDDGMRLQVVDPTVKIGEFEDVSKVEKFELSEDAYSKRSDSVRAFKERHKMGRFQEVDPKEQKRIEEEKVKKAEAEKQKADTITVGDRCEVRVPDQLIKRGKVKFVGLTDFKDGYWVGVQYDEPVGKNDGSLKGRRYFECPPKYGGFVRVDNVEVGDFPEEDLGFSDDDEI